ncbi:MAG: DUF3267 domain-containing protein [Bacteroidetes bacterium]|nr:MAG: DUF3267 domain-containing protein [Bacteroidota bacterium]
MRNQHLLVIDKLDFRNNRKELILSYILRAVGTVVFGAIFYWFYAKFYGALSFFTLVNIEINTVSPIVSIVLLILYIVFVLYLHEMIHATVFYITHGQKPIIGMKGLVIFAAAPEQTLSKKQLIINALAPISVITIIGLLALSVVPADFASWVFIPTLVNAAAAGGDLMTVYFALKQKPDTLFNDIGDIIYALENDIKRKGQK